MQTKIKAGKTSELFLVGRVTLIEVAHLPVPHHSSAPTHGNNDSVGIWPPCLKGLYSLGTQICVLGIGGHFRAV